MAEDEDYDFNVGGQDDYDIRELDPEDDYDL